MLPLATWLRQLARPFSHCPQLPSRESQWEWPSWSSWSSCVEFVVVSVVVDSEQPCKAPEKTAASKTRSIRRMSMTWSFSERKMLLKWQYDTLRRPVTRPLPELMPFSKSHGLCDCLIRWVHLGMIDFNTVSAMNTLCRRNASLIDFHSMLNLRNSLLWNCALLFHVFSCF